MHRLFVAIRPPPDIRDLLLDAMDDSADFRWQSDDQLHLTLRFIGEVERTLGDDIASALATARGPSFDLRLTGLGAFDHRGGGALWAGVEPEEPVRALASRVERICQSAGLAAERRAFKPHITIARWSGRRSREARAFLDGRSLNSAPFTVDRFILFESRLSRHGAHYEAVEEYPLSAPSR
jgi:2'-5' RNA ligase